MRRTILAIALGVVGALGVSAVSATDDLPRTFLGCAMQGGDVRAVDDDLTCRLVRAYDFRVYGMGTTECGEEIQLEIWGETHTGVVTYLFQTSPRIWLPETGLDDVALPEGPFECLDD